MKLKKRLFAACMFFAVNGLGFFWPLDLARSYSIYDDLNEHYSYLKDGYDLWQGERTIDEPIVVPENKLLIIEKGAEIIFKSEGKLEIKGGLDIRGTKKEPVIFRGDEDFHQTMIEMSGKSDRYIKNTEISGGGHCNHEMPDQSIFDWFLPSVYASDDRCTEYSGAIEIQGGGVVDLDAVVFRENELAVHVSASMDDSKVSIARSKFYDSNNNYLIIDSASHVNAKYNWWDDRQESKVIGNADLDWPMENENFKDPVIVIPGIMGSAEKDGAWELDPIYHTYDDLWTYLKDFGYEENKNLFKFPYQWRNSNIENAKLLRDKIEEIRQQTHWPKVDIIAHSMGGLLTGEYWLEYGYDDNGEIIDQLITLGTPHNGAVDSYVLWENGLFPKNAGVVDMAESIYLNFIFKQEAEEGGYDSPFKYIRNHPITSVKELLPIYEYLCEDIPALNVCEIRGYPLRYPENNFLESLYKRGYGELSYMVEFTNIVGRLSGDDDTITEIRVGASGVEGDVWEHGKPHGYDSIIGGRGLSYGAGDGTVPLLSASKISATYEIAVDAGHRKLPTEARGEVVGTLLGLGSVVDSGPVLFGVDKMYLLFVFSPVDVQIVGPDGKRVGKDFDEGENLMEIPGSYYSGFETDNEFLSVPNFVEGEYKVIIKGTDNGPYRIEMTALSEVGDEVKEVELNFSGQAEAGKVEEKFFTITKDGLVEGRVVQSGSNDEANGNKDDDKSDDDEKEDDSSSVKERGDGIEGDGGDVSLGGGYVDGGDNGGGRGNGVESGEGNEGVRNDKGIVLGGKERIGIEWLTLLKCLLLVLLALFVVVFASKRVLIGGQNEE